MLQTVIIFIPLLITVDSVAISKNLNETSSKNNLTTDHLDTFTPTADLYETLLSTLHDKGKFNDQNTPHNVYPRRFTNHYLHDNTFKVKITNSNDQQKSGAEIDAIPNIRHKREGPAFMKLLKGFFVTTTTAQTPTEVTAEETANKLSTQSPITRQNLLQNGNVEEEEIEKERIDKLACKLDETLQKLTTDLLKSKDDQGFLLIKIPFNSKDVINYRWKRELKEGREAIVTEETAVNKGLNITKRLENNNRSVGYLTEITENKDLYKSKELQKNSGQKRSNVTSYNETPTENIYEKTTNTNFRKFSESVRLVLQIKEVYKDIKKQMIPMQNMKAQFSINTAYKVGYIIANMETLELTLRKLIEKNNKDIWNVNLSHKILDKLKLSETVVSNLMTYLKMYTKSPTENKS